MQHFWQQKYLLKFPLSFLDFDCRFWQRETKKANKWVSGNMVVAMECVPSISPRNKTSRSGESDKPEENAVGNCCKWTQLVLHFFSHPTPPWWCCRLIWRKFTGDGEAVFVSSGLSAVAEVAKVVKTSMSGWGSVSDLLKPCYCSSYKASMFESPSLDEAVLQIRLRVSWKWMWRLGTKPTDQPTRIVVWSKMHTQSFLIFKLKPQGGTWVLLHSACIMMGTKASVFFINVVGVYYLIDLEKNQNNRVGHHVKCHM